MRHKLFTRSVFVILLGLLAMPAGAGGTEEFGDYRVHYNALATDMLAPSVATAYGVVRSRNRALLNISVTRKQDKPGVHSVEAIVNVTASNLSGQVKNIRMRKVMDDGDSPAIYYLGEVSVADGETLIFDIKVTPQGHTETFDVQFKQQFFTN